MKGCLINNIHTVGGFLDELVATSISTRPKRCDIINSIEQDFCFTFRSSKNFSSTNGKVCEAITNGVWREIFWGILHLNHVNEQGQLVILHDLSPCFSLFYFILKNSFVWYNDMDTIKLWEMNGDWKKTGEYVGFMEWGGKVALCMQIQVHHRLSVLSKRTGFLPFSNCPIPQLR